jgi:HK97 gp10 family phage protein
MSTFDVPGLDALQRTLSELPDKLARTVVRGGLRAGAVVMQQEARALVPERTGALRKSIKVSTGIKAGNVYSRVRAGDKVAFYAHLVEFGTGAHKIGAKSGKFLSINGRLVRTANHPGARGKPFMRPAMDGRAGAALDAMRGYLAERIDREIAKIKAGG